MSARAALATAAVCALLGPPTGPPAAAADLGRLFTTPEERAMLERLRHMPREEQTPAAVVTANPVDKPPLSIDPFTVNGMVLGSDGTSTVWVNGMDSLSGDFASRHIEVVSTPRGGAVTIRTPGELPDVRLKPGQTFEPAEQRIVELSGSGPPAAKP